MKRRNIAGSKLDEATKNFAYHCLEKNHLAQVDQLLYKGATANRRRSKQKGPRAKSPKPGPSGGHEPAEPNPINGFTLRCTYEDLPRVYAFVQNHLPPRPTIVVEPGTEPAPIQPKVPALPRVRPAASGSARAAKKKAESITSPEVVPRPIEPYSPPVEAIDRFDYEARKRQKAFVTTEEYEHLEKRRKEQKALSKPEKRIAHTPKLQVQIQRTEEDESSRGADSGKSSEGASEAEVTLAASTPEQPMVPWTTLNESVASDQPTVD